MISSWSHRGPAPDAAGQPRERVVAPHQPWIEVLELRQLDLQLAVGRLRPLREDVEDQLGAVEDLEGGGLGDVDGLGRRQVGVEDDEVEQYETNEEEERHQRRTIDCWIHQAHTHGREATQLAYKHFKLKPQGSSQPTLFS